MFFDKLTNRKSGSVEPLLRYFALCVIVVGVLLRIVVYLQCNSMYIDEANIARNIYERTYAGLVHPLSYDQFAPPVFLWVVKTSTVLFGFSEYAYRLYPLVGGIFSLILMYFVLKEYTGYKGICYAMLLLALGPLYVRYTQATKQYAPDMLITLLLIWLALKNTITNKPALKLFLIWTIAGSVAIWSSMPSVFILVGVGAYYLFSMYRDKHYSKLWFLVAVGLVWLLQFALYYVVILKDQTGIRGLVNYHKDFFFYYPTSWLIFRKDCGLVLYFISTAGGHLGLPLVFHIILIALAAIVIGRNDMAKLLLITMPVIAVFFAAALHQYTLIHRVTLFAMPLLLILIGVGIEQILRVKLGIVRVAAVVIAIICVVDFNVLRNFIYPMQEEEMKLSLTFLKKKNITSDELYVENLASPAYIYYTQIHPERNKWASLGTGTEIIWNTDLDTLSKGFPPRAAMLYSWDEEYNIAREQLAVRRNVKLVDSNIVKGGRVYIYEK